MPQAEWDAPPLDTGKVWRIEVALILTHLITLTGLMDAATAQIVTFAQHFGSHHLKRSEAIG